MESYPSCTLIPLDKNPGIQPIGVREVLRRIIGKTISTFLKEKIKLAAGPLQVCDGHNAGAKAAVYIYAMAQTVGDDGTDRILLTATSKLLALKCPYHQHVQKSLEIVHLCRGRDLIPGRDNTG